jgi:acyl-CoA thioesterase I
MHSALLALLMAGCAEPRQNAPAPPEAAMDSTSVAPSTTGTVLFLGTSLTAGLGLPPEQAFPAVIQEKMDSAGLPFRAVNAGVSGETSAAALRRIEWLLRQPFEVLVLETGANDMLRGTDLDSTRANLDAIIRRVRTARPEADVVLVGMMAPPNLGRAYGDRFRRLYPDLAGEHGLLLVPFLLQDVGGVAAFNQADGIHPNVEGQRLVARNVWVVLEPLLRARAVRGQASRNP